MHLAEIEQGKILEPTAPVRASIEDGPLEELAESIKELGLLQPLIVRPDGDKFEVIAGHRRLLATRRVGIPRVQCLVVDQEDDNEVTAARLHENIYRQDMSPVEEAAVYAELFERYLDVDQVAKLVHRSRGVVENRLNILAGDRDVLNKLQAGLITVGVAEQLNKVKDNGVRKYLLEYAERDGASVEKVRNWRLQYHGVTFDQVNPQVPPVTSQDSQLVLTTFQAPKCYICGSDSDQHEIKWLPVHASCQRMVERQAEQQQEVKPNGH
jgi:ParB family transcriptional regulator, chromosome partitioning protein